MKNAMFAFLNCTWGIIQTLFGLVVLIVTLPFLKKMFWYCGAVVCEGKLKFGLSLGLFIFTYYESNFETIKHEYGHCIQSAILGPAYLIAVGIISFLRSITARAVYQFLKRNPRDIIAWYYGGYPEKWADKLGGVKR